MPSPTETAITAVDAEAVACLESYRTWLVATSKAGLKSIQQQTETYCTKNNIFPAALPPGFATKLAYRKPPPSPLIRKTPTGAVSFREEREVFVRDSHHALHRFSDEEAGFQYLHHPEHINNGADNIKAKPVPLRERPEAISKQLVRYAFPTMNRYPVMQKKHLILTHPHSPEAKPPNLPPCRRANSSLQRQRNRTRHRASPRHPRRYSSKLRPGAPLLHNRSLGEWIPSAKPSPSPSPVRKNL